MPTKSLTRPSKGSPPPSQILVLIGIQTLLSFNARKRATRHSIDIMPFICLDDVCPGARFYAEAGKNSWIPGHVFLMCRLALSFISKFETKLQMCIYPPGLLGAIPLLSTRHQIVISQGNNLKTWFLLLRIVSYITSAMTAVKTKATANKVTIRTKAAFPFCVLRKSGMQ